MGRDEDSDHDENALATTRSRRPLRRKRRTATRRPSLPKDFSPLRTIWTRPRETIRTIVAVDPTRHVLVLTCLAGVGHGLQNATRRNAADHISTESTLAAVLLGGPIGALIGLWIAAFLIQLTGRWIGGTGKQIDIRAAAAWTSVPAVWALLLWIPTLLMHGTDIFQEPAADEDLPPAVFAASIALDLIELVLAIWGLVLLCNTVAEVQGFASAWRGLGNVLLALLALLVILGFSFFAIGALVQIL